MNEPGQAAVAAQAERSSATAATLELLPDAVVIVDREGTVTACNTMAARLLGKPAAEIIGADASGALVLSDEAGSDWWAVASPLAGDANLLARVPETELQLQTASHGRRPVTLAASRIPDEDGAVAQLVVVLRRAERRHMLDAARSELVSTVSHELRSPLTSVKGFTKTLLAKWDRFNDEQKKQMLATVNEDADRVTRLLGELLDVSRIDAGRVQLRRQMVEIAAIVRKVVDRLVAADDAAERIRVELDEELPELYADPDKIDQILTNLLENGLKYGDGRITVTAAVSEAEVTMRVSDEGPGIDDEHLRSIFAKFFRRAGERRSGTGLGLYITKGLVEAHGGRVWADSEPGRGSTFHFTLPRGGLELAGVDLEALRAASRE